MRILPVIFLLLSVTTAGQAQTLSSRSIDSLVERTLRTFEVPGIALCIIRDGKVIHSKGYGVRSLDTRQPVDEQTLFGIASNSKAFTTAALGMLVDEGKLNWDDKVRKYIPEFRLFDPYVTEEFTVRTFCATAVAWGWAPATSCSFPIPAISLSPISFTISSSLLP
jgi:CubicO group peptidase (beta-lactamase class C family)